MEEMKIAQMIARVLVLMQFNRFKKYYLIAGALLLAKILLF